MLYLWGPCGVQDFNVMQCNACHLYKCVSWGYAAFVCVDGMLCCVSAFDGKEDSSVWQDVFCPLWGLFIQAECQHRCPLRSLAPHQKVFISIPNPLSCPRSFSLLWPGTATPSRASSRPLAQRKRGHRQCYIALQSFEELARTAASSFEVNQTSCNKNSRTF